jgi:hypothetical protein
LFECGGGRDNSVLVHPFGTLPSPFLMDWPAINMPQKKTTSMSRLWLWLNNKGNC